METLRDIPFLLDVKLLMERLHVEPRSEDAGDLEALATVAARVGKPKAAYAVSFIEARDGDSVRIGGVSFRSRTLSRNLESVERVFPIIATCGREMDQEFPACGDALKEFWWDHIKSVLLGAASQFLGDHLHRVFRLGKTAIMRPGSGDASVWPIEQQEGLFALMGDVKGAIGVELTPSFLMVPNKTTSGILFPAEEDFRSCEVCHRDGCPSRHAPFNKLLWDETRLRGTAVDDRRPVGLRSVSHGRRSRQHGEASWQWVEFRGSLWVEDICRRSLAAIPSAAKGYLSSPIARCGT